MQRIRIFIIILVYATMSLKSVAQQNTFDQVPFRVIWNSPTELCKRRHNIDINLSKFGIESNVNQSWGGEVIRLLYESQFGEWPLIKNKTLLNGGIPPRGSLESHIRQVYRDLITIPPDFQGLGVIDMEAYVPLWKMMKRQISSVYYEETVRYFNQTFDVSQMNVSTFRDMMEDVWDTPYKRFFTRSMKILRKQKPKALWGYYAWPRCARVHTTYACDSNMKRYNEEMMWYYEAVNVLYPAFYMNRGYIKEPENRARHLIQLMNEALRISRLRRNGEVPIYNYARYVYDREKVFLDMVDLKNAVGQAVDMAQDGVIFWGAHEDIGDCKGLASYVENMLGPMSLQMINFANECSKMVCNGKGRCIRIEFKDRDILPPKILKPYYKGFYSLTRAAVNYALYTCICYPGWFNDNCNVTMTTNPSP